MRQHKFWFALANIIIVSVAAIFFIRPQVQAFQIARDSVRIAEMRYAAGRQQALEFEDNLQLLEILADEALPSRDELLLILAEISHLATMHSLTQLTFTAVEPMGFHLSDVSYIFEMRVRAEYEGELQDITEFLESLHDDVNIRTVSANFENLQQTRILLELSVFAVE